MTARARTVLLLLGWLVCRPSFVAAAPPNDECTAATVIKRLPSTRTLVVDGAIANDSDPLSSCGVGDANVWYVYTARADVHLELDATASTYSAAISVYGGECATPTERACSDRSADGGPGHLIVAVRKGETVRIALTTFSDPGSTLKLVARKSDPRYVAPKQVAEIVRSSDASPYGGSQGALITAVAESEKSTVFMQDTGGIFADVGGTLTTIAYSGAPTPVGGTFATFAPPAVSATDVYFLAELDGAPVTEAIFRWNGTTVQPFLVPGSPGPAGTTLRDFGTRLAVAKGSERSPSSPARSTRRTPS